MQGGDLDTYNAEFNQLHKIAGFKSDKMGTMELYKGGLNRGLLDSIIDNYETAPDTLEKWQEEARKRQIRWLEKKNIRPGGLTPHEQKWAHALNLKNYAPKRHGNGNQVVKMDVDAAQVNTIRFQPLTDQEREELRKQGACFRCRKPGHNARNCRGGQPPQGYRSPSGVTGQPGDRGRGQNSQHVRTTDAPAPTTKENFESYMKSDEGKQFFKDHFQATALELPEEERANLLDAMLGKDF